MKFDTPYDIRRGPLLARNVVATSQPLAAQAGLSMLYKGGNAIDAALAAAITLTVVEPSGNGLGSDAFAILWDGDALHGLNASGRSPAGLTATEVTERGWGSVTVPGAVSGWVALSDRFGALPFETLFGPAIDYAENGFPVSPIIARLWEIAGKTLGQQPGFADCFLPNGRAPKAGEVFRNPAQAKSLRLIAETKGTAFYTGVLAEQIVADAARHGSALSMSDLADHSPDWCGTLSQDYAAVALHEIPPNGQGIAALSALGILGHFDLASHAPDSPQALHLQIEAIKLGLADAEAFVADPAHMDVTPSEMLNPAYLARRAAEIDPEKAKIAVEGAPKHGGTVYITAADASGKMVSLIQSNYMGFGSGVVVPDTGISLQNRGAGFVETPGHANQIGPSKRPFQTIIPGFVMQDGAPLMSFGVMGGPMQAQGHVQMVTRMMVHGQSPQAASDAPRWRFVSGVEVAVESTMPDETVAALENIGHKITREAPDNAFGFGGAQLIARQGDGYVAGSDHRKDGCAVGF
ncbi:gamma-glutamyltransferase family protein [Sulfitobacter sp. CW3]|uniref:gamma-glutamyltransferase family protein n=1 Tax=Sulfitobacter sp. CW3 TaxID=2861965 RepID=UPI001C5EA082|nr:gamma-glutamyltransferase family protein [Sulfitobacter sp. CW3]MBW4963484.1 gamma-glutamyltransferase family protein [Sulfitobacter sp. CW3]